MTQSPSSFGRRLCITTCTPTTSGRTPGPEWRSPTHLRDAVRTRYVSVLTLCLLPGLGALCSVRVGLADDTRPGSEGWGLTRGRACCPRLDALRSFCSLACSLTRWCRALSPGGRRAWERGPVGLPRVVPSTPQARGSTPILRRSERLPQAPDLVVRERSSSGETECPDVVAKERIVTRDHEAADVSLLSLVSAHPGELCQSCCCPVL